MPDLILRGSSCQRLHVLTVRPGLLHAVKFGCLGFRARGPLATHLTALDPYPCGFLGWPQHVAMGSRKQLKVLAKNPGLKEDLVAQWTKSPELLEAYNVCAFKVS